MLYPIFLKENDLIGITAPSAGVGRKIESFDKSINSIHKAGYRTLETEHVRINNEVSATSQIRAKELDEIITNKDVSMVMCATGGDFLIDMLPFVRFDNISQNPKWVMGYSDPTSLLYIITTKLDIATIYGLNAGSYDQEILHKSLQNNLEILKGNLVNQESFDLYEKEEDESKDGYNLTEKVFWKNLNGNFSVEGRIIGGCIDCLRDLIGTTYDNTVNFIEKYKDDGIIWYFDIFSLTSEEFYRSLFQMREAGWFKYTKAVIVGRVRFPNSFTQMTYEKALLKIFGKIPIVFDTDIGHVSPKMTIINGGVANIESKDGKGSINFKLK